MASSLQLLIRPKGAVCGALTLPLLLAACASPAPRSDAARATDALPDIRAPIDLQRWKQGWTNAAAKAATGANVPGGRK